MTDDIPYGDYCYTIKKVFIYETDDFKIQITLCPYYQHFDDGLVGCDYLKIKEDENNSDILLSDQIKMCGINELEMEEDVNE